jgi:hypothetical protein
MDSREEPKLTFMPAGLFFWLVAQRIEGNTNVRVIVLTAC